MNKITEEEIIQFLKEETYEDEITSETDIFIECGVSGDDCGELLDAYRKKYNVDMSEYLWYFHHEEEGSWNSFGGGFFKSPNERVTRIPITPNMLMEFANIRKWDVNYPEHTLPKYRYDIIINQVVLIILILFLIYKFVIK